MASTVEVATAPAQRPLRNNNGSGPHTNARTGIRNQNRDPERRRNPGQHDSRPESAQQEGARRGRRNKRESKANISSDHPGQPGSQVSKFSNKPVPVLDPPPGLGGGGTFGCRLTKDATKTEGEVLTKAQDTKGEQEGEGELCFICASPVVYHSVAPCNHRTCHICALRLRALYKNTACAHCRVSSLNSHEWRQILLTSFQTQADHVVFTSDPSKRYEDFTDADFQETDDGLGIRYTQKEIHNDTHLLLRFNCPDINCDIACWGWPNLHHHVKSAHHKVLCDLCARNKKVFTHEHELFTSIELRNHEKHGDDNPGAVDQSGFRGHPECGFCRERFYGDDELYAHCRDKHEKCHICERRNNSRQQQYYVDYDSLELHFRNDHFLCLDQECLDKKFVVFESEMDLKAHQLEVHPGGLSKDARKDVRRVDISSFDYRAPHHQPNRGGRRERDGRPGIGRDPNTEALLQSTAQPLRRDEIAFQRQLAIHSAQTVSTRTFGGQLTITDAPAGRRANRTQETVSTTAPRTQPSPVQPLEHPALSPPASETPQEQARRLQHASVTDRATAMLRHDPSKLSSFRSSVSSYRTSCLSAAQLLDAFFSLFDVPSAELGKLIKELAELYEIDGKREDLLKAWNDWRAINEDYPTLPGSGGGLLLGSSTNSATGGGRHVLKLKSSTAQSSRSAVSKQGSWGNAAKANTFPSISVSGNRAGPGRVGPTPWIAPFPSLPLSSISTSHPSSSTASSRPLPTSSSTAAAATDAFPALPAAARPNVLIAGQTKGTIRWDNSRNSSAPPNPWAGSASGDSTESFSSKGPVGNAHSNGDETDGAASQNGVKKKAGKGKKHMLYKFG